MPLVQITMIEGRSREEKERLIKDVTNTVNATIDVPKERVHVFIYDVPATDCGSAGVPAAVALANKS